MEPVFEGPVFLFGTAADVDGDAGLVGGLGLEVGAVEVVVFQEHGELFEALGELPGGVGAFGLYEGEALNEGFDADAFEAGAEEAVGIVK